MKSFHGQVIHYSQKLGKIILNMMSQLVLTDFKKKIVVNVLI